MRDINFDCAKKMGREINSFSISKDKIHNLQAATGYQGADADAIEKFRKFGKEHYPDIFKHSIETF